MRGRVMLDYDINRVIMSMMDMQKDEMMSCFMAALRILEVCHGMTEAEVIVHMIETKEARDKMWDITADMV